MRPPSRPPASHEIGAKTSRAGTRSVDGSLPAGQRAISAPGPGLEHSDVLVCQFRRLKGACGWLPQSDAGAPLVPATPALGFARFGGRAARPVELGKSILVLALGGFELGPELGNRGS